MTSRISEGLHDGRGNWRIRGTVDPRLMSPLAKFDGEFASHASTYTGTGTLRYAW
jgi:hypothetical protein